MELKGFRVHQVPDGTTTKDLCSYFEKSQNGGTEIEDIHYPLSDNDAIIIFSNDGQSFGIKSIKIDVLNSKGKITCDVKV